jgi:outer membrane protein TolC
VQLRQPPGTDQGSAPITVTLKDALDRARKLDPGTVSALGDVKSAHDDRLQARNALLPTFSASSQYLNTEGNGVTTDGRFVTNDGVHVYREWLVFHQDLSPATLMGTGIHRADAAEALARAKAEIARRGLTVTVTKDYYALAVAQRKYATAQQALDEAQHFLDISQAQEREGQSAHSDVVKAQIQYQQQETAYDESRLAMEDARLDLAVLLFPTLNENFSVVDDLDSPTALPTFEEIQAMAGRDNPDLRVAIETQREADLDVKTAKNAFLPTLTVDNDYGIEANAIGLSEKQAAFPELGPVPTLGYFLTVALNVPLWDWGTLRSKAHQAEYKQESARAQLSQTQRSVLSELYAAYNEASVARAAVDKLRLTADLAAESLRLVNLRYQGGASPALEVVDAETTLTAARNAYDDGQVRYRLALANLQTLTGSF